MLLRMYTHCYSSFFYSSNFSTWWEIFEKKINRNIIISSLNFSVYPIIVSTNVKWHSHICITYKCIVGVTMIETYAQWHTHPQWCTVHGRISMNKNERKNEWRKMKKEKTETRWKKTEFRNKDLYQFISFTIIQMLSVSIL